MKAIKWQDLSRQEKAMLLLARYEGRDIEYRFFSGNTVMWCVAPDDWDFEGDKVYRVRPETVRITNFHEKAKGYAIEFDVGEDGPILSTVTMFAC